ncbi:hypothetical protein U1Q18_022567, partial [Sarracenia purpurea var. burkii]
MTRSENRWRESWRGDECEAKSGAPSGTKREVEVATVISEDQRGGSITVRLGESDIEKELDIRSSDWSFKLEKYRSEE